MVKKQLGCLCVNALALTTMSKLKCSEHSEHKPLQYNSLFLVTCPHPLETPAFQTSYFIIHICELVHKLYLKSRGKLRVYCLLHTMFIGFQNQYSYMCLTFSVLSKTMVFLSATIVQGGCGKCLLPWSLLGSLKCNVGSAVIIVLTCTSY